MSFQAYLDNIETKTGKTPNEFIAIAKDKGFGADTRYTALRRLKKPLNFDKD